MIILYDKLIFMDSASYEKLPAIIINRIAVFFFLMSLLICFLYFLGTRQEFMDETQLLLLRLSSIMGFLLVISSVFGLFINMVIFIMKKKIRYILGFFMFIFFIVSGGIIAGGTYFISLLTSGNVN